MSKSTSPAWPYSCVPVTPGSQDLTPMGAWSTPHTQCQNGLHFSGLPLRASSSPDLDSVLGQGATRKPTHCGGRAAVSALCSACPGPCPQALVGSAHCSVLLCASPVSQSTMAASQRRLCCGCFVSFHSSAPPGIRLGRMEPRPKADLRMLHQACIAS